MKGTVTRVFLPRGFGFVKGDDGLDYFLQAQALAGPSWDGATIREGVRVEFLPDGNGDGGNGLRAMEVRLCVVLKQHHADDCLCGECAGDGRDTFPVKLK